MATEDAPATTPSMVTVPEAREVLIQDTVDQHIFKVSEPQGSIWTSGVDDPSFSKKAKVEMNFFLNSVDPKSGTFELSVRCNFWIRWPRGEDLEAKKMLPSIRIPSCAMETSEARLFNDKDYETEASSLWRGIVSFKLSGYELFEVPEFPFDRQVIDLKLVDFRWLPDLTKKIDVVELQVKTVSRQAAWDPFFAIVEAEKVKGGSGDQPAYAARFKTILRFQRKPGFYITNIFLIAYGILIAALVPMGMHADEVGDRIGIFAGGLLTLVVFKYGISESLPQVPYSTMTDYFLMSQIATLIGAMLEALLGYKLVGSGDISVEKMSLVDTILLGALVGIWTCTMAYVAFIRQNRRRPWKEVLSKQEEQHQELSGP